MYGSTSSRVLSLEDDEEEVLGEIQKEIDESRIIIDISQEQSAAYTSSSSSSSAACTSSPSIAMSSIAESDSAYSKKHGLKRSTSSLGDTKIHPMFIPGEMMKLKKQRLDDFVAEQTRGVLLEPVPESTSSGKKRGPGRPPKNPPKEYVGGSTAPFASH